MASITADSLEAKIRGKVEGCEYVKVVDLSEGSCGLKFEITVVSPQFMGLSIIAQHRIIHKALEEERPQIHALTLKTKTPESWQSENQPNSP
jgi:stress-induced morphogen